MDHQKDALRRETRVFHTLCPSTDACESTRVLTGATNEFERGGRFTNMGSTDDNAKPQDPVRGLGAIPCPHPDGTSRQKGVSVSAKCSETDTQQDQG